MASRIFFAVVVFGAVARAHELTASIEPSAVNTNSIEIIPVRTETEYVTVTAYPTGGAESSDFATFTESAMPSLTDGAAPLDSMTYTDSAMPTDFPTATDGAESSEFASFTDSAMPTGFPTATDGAESSDTARLTDSAVPTGFATTDSAPVSAVASSSNAPPSTLITSTLSSPNITGTAPATTGSSSTSLMVTKDGQCGGTQTCTGSTVFGPCCSAFGFCGNSAVHCNAGCNAAFGNCGTSVNSIASALSSVGVPKRFMRYVMR